MIAHVAELVGPDDVASAEHEGSGLKHRIAARGADTVAFTKGAVSGGDHFRAEQFGEGGALETERGKNGCVIVGNGAGLRPEVGEEGAAAFHRVMENENNAGVRRILLGLLA